MPVIQKTDSLSDKRVEEWSNKDFLLYFSNKLETSTGRKLAIEGPAWAGFLSRIKGFRSKLRLGNVQYKEFIDAMFTAFKDREYTPVFGAIVSERVYFVVSRMQKKTSQQYSDFEALQKELYSNRLWFTKINQ